MLKITLAIIVFVSWTCGFYFYFRSFEAASIPVLFYYLFPLIFVINVLCGTFLYSKALKDKTEWALFGLLGNFNAILVYWIWRHFKERWEQGETVFRE